MPESSEIKKITLMCRQKYNKTVSLSHAFHNFAMRMVGGHPIPVNSTEFAHHVSHGYFETDMSRVIVTCGGTLLSMRYFKCMQYILFIKYLFCRIVLTAAHCYEYLRGPLIFHGMYNSCLDSEPTRQFRSIKKWHVHDAFLRNATKTVKYFGRYSLELDDNIDGFKSDFAENDLALVELGVPFQRTKFLREIEESRFFLHDPYFKEFEKNLFGKTLKIPGMGGSGENTIAIACDSES